jgi:hypothetical protein
MLSKELQKHVVIHEVWKKYHLVIEKSNFYKLGLFQRETLNIKFSTILKKYVIIKN